MEDVETKAKSRNTMTTILWTTPETSAIKNFQAEEEAFLKTSMKRFGIYVSSAELKQFGMGAFMNSNGASEEGMDKEFLKFKHEMAKVKGYPIRTVVNWQVDDEKASASKEKGTTSEDAIDPFGGLSGVLGGLKSSATQKVISGISPEKKAPFFSSTTEVKAIKIDSIPSDIFEIPSGYVNP